MLKSEAWNDCLDSKENIHLCILKLALLLVDGTNIYCRVLTTSVKYVLDQRETGCFLALFCLL